MLRKDNYIDFIFISFDRYEIISVAKEKDFYIIFVKFYHNNFVEVEKGYHDKSPTNDIIGFKINSNDKFNEQLYYIDKDTNKYIEVGLIEGDGKDIKSELICTIENIIKYL